MRSAREVLLRGCSLRLARGTRREGRTETARTRHRHRFDRLDFLAGFVQHAHLTDNCFRDEKVLRLLV